MDTDKQEPSLHIEELPDTPDTDTSEHFHVSPNGDISMAVTRRDKGDSGDDVIVRTVLKKLNLFKLLSE